MFIEDKIRQKIKAEELKKNTQRIPNTELTRKSSSRLIDKIFSVAKKKKEEKDKINKKAA